jgi:hypothetical protein
MKHPHESELALLAGGDLSLVRSWVVRQHAKSCAECHGVLASFEQSRKEFQHHCNALPEGVNWDRLAAEMSANIHVGLAAGRCVAEPVTQTAVAHFSWRPALAGVAAVLLLMSGWWLNDSTRGRHAAAVAVDTGISLEASPNGIQVKENGSALTLMTSGVPALVSVSTQGAVRARSIDNDTGQVTITSVYAE